MIEHIQPPDLFPGAKLGFTQVVTATADRLVWVAGQTACDQRGLSSTSGMSRFVPAWYLS